MSPLVAQGLLLQDCTLNIDAEDENKVAGVLNTRWEFQETLQLHPAPWTETMTLTFSHKQD